MARAALIFGGSGDIGSALVRRLRAEGWQVAIAARGPERLARVVTETGAIALVSDATQSSDVEQATEEAATRFGRLDAVAHCVGSIYLKPAHMTSDEAWHQTLDLNLNSAFYVLRSAVKRMRKGGGSIALCSSAAAQIGLANHEAISAAKAGVCGLVRAAAASYAPVGIRINAVAPGLVDTELAKPITSNEGSLKVSREMHPLGRIGRPEDIASALHWLLSEEQGWVTGQILSVDGGLGSIKTR